MQQRGCERLQVSPPRKGRFILAHKHNHMTKLNNYIHKIYQFGAYALSGTLLLAFFQLPAITTETPQPIPMSVAAVHAGNVIRAEKVELVEEFFGVEAATDKTQATIDQKIALVSSRKAYSASLAVIQRHEKTIKRKAAEVGVPEDVAIGVGLLENGGSDTAVSSAGALGVFQLMPGTARNLGLKVDKKADERKNPEKNIEAGMAYLAQNYERFGDWGLATWAYHAGEGNVAKALKIYAKANSNVELAGVKNAKELRDYVEKHDITIHKLLSDPKVKAFTNKLKDDSQGYPYKVVATAALFREAQ